MSVDFIVGIDMGTTKISILIGELSSPRNVRLIGAAVCPSEGIRKGVVVDLDKAADCVRSAREESEKMAGVEIKGVCAGVAATHIKSFNSRGVVAVPNRRGEITPKDVQRVIDAARSITLPFDREIIHALPQDFVVDNQNGIIDPVGMSAMRLEANVHIVTALSTQIENLSKVLRKAGLEIVDLVFEPIATGRAVLTAEEMDTGCLLLDMGGGVTGYALCYGGSVRSSGVVSLGGKNITGDLAIGLRTPVSVAEKLKLLHGVALTSLAENEDKVEVPGAWSRGGLEISSQTIAAIIEPRCEEVFGMVKRAVCTEPYYRMLGGGIVLTGGGSRVKGMDSVAEQVFDMPVRRGLPLRLEGLSEMASDESQSTGVGLLEYESDRLLELGGGVGPGERFKWMVKGLKRIAGLF